MSDPVRVLGAGPAGLTAAIVLAKHGLEVEVYERQQRVGQRFHDDLQGLENWTTEGDVLRNSLKPALRSISTVDRSWGAGFTTRALNPLM